MKSRRTVKHVHTAQAPRAIDRRMACPFCNNPVDIRLPLIGGDGGDYAYGHAIGSEMTFHYAIEALASKDPEAVEMSEDRTYMYEAKGEEHAY